MLLALLNVLNISIVGMISVPPPTRNGRESRQSRLKYSLSLRSRVAAPVDAVQDARARRGRLGGPSLHARVELEVPPAASK